MMRFYGGPGLQESLLAVILSKFLWLATSQPAHHGPLRLLIEVLAGDSDRPKLQSEGFIRVALMTEGLRWDDVRPMPELAQPDLSLSRSPPTRLLARLRSALDESRLRELRSDHLEAALGRERLR